MVAKYFPQNFSRIPICDHNIFSKQIAPILPPIFLASRKWFNLPDFLENSMRRTGKEFRAAAVKHGIHEWKSHDCAICGYIVGWLFGEEHELVIFDHGCDCTGRRSHSTKTWEDVANNYNIQTNEKVIAEMDKFWGFSE